MCCTIATFIHGNIIIIVGLGDGVAYACIELYLVDIALYFMAAQQHCNLKLYMQSIYIRARLTTARLPRQPLVMILLVIIIIILIVVV